MEIVTGDFSASIIDGFALADSGYPNGLPSMDNGLIEVADNDGGPVGIAKMPVDFVAPHDEMIDEQDEDLATIGIAR